MGGRGDVPVYFVVFKEGDGGVAVTGDEFGGDPGVGVDALEVVGGWGRYCWCG